MKTIEQLKLAALIGAAGVIAQPSLAADASAASGDTLETIVVTAEKRSESLKDIPMSVSALGGTSLDKLQARDFSDYAALVPGLTLTSAQPGLSQLTLRGQNAGGSGSTVAVYVDESPFGSSNALVDGSIISGDFDTWDLKRIEVLRGPQGTLYGANSEGGLLKFVTNEPQLGAFKGAAEVTGESVSHGGLGGDVRAMVNLPLGDKVALRVSGFDADVPGYIKDSASGDKDVNEGHKYGGRVSLLAAPSDDFSVRLSALSQQSRYQGEPAVDVDPITLKPVRGDLSQQRFIQEPSSFKYENYNALINWNAGPVSILSTSSYSVINTDVVNDLTSFLVVPPSLTYGGLVSGAFAQPLGVSFDNASNLKKFTQELRLSSPNSLHFEWQVGGYYTRETGLLGQHLVGFDPATGVAPNLGGPLEFVTLGSTYKEWAGFANATYHFGGGFDLQAGGRYSSNEQTATEGLAGLLIGAPTSFSTPSKGNVFTYSVAPSWHWDVNSMIYGRLATGFRPGGPNALEPSAPPAVPREYGSDKTTNYELGVKSTQLEGRLSLDVAAFYVNWKDIQLVQVIDNFGIVANGGTAKSRGFEWTLGYVPVQNLTLQWTGAYTHANLTSPAPAVGAVSGDALPFVPKWSTSLDGQYEWAAFADYKAFAGATWSYFGTRSTNFGSAVGGVSQVQLPSYNTLAARLGVENERYSATLWAKNLNDALGITAYSNTGAPGLNGTISVIQPRSVGFTLAAKF